MNKFTFLAILLIGFYGQSQVNYTTDEGASFQFDNVTSGAPIRVSENSERKVKGSQFLNEEWQQATIFDTKNKKKIKLLARFNAYTKEIEVLKEKRTVSLTPVDEISVLLDGKNFYPLKISGSNKKIFAERLVKGEISLFRVYDTKIVKAVSDSALLGIDNEDKLAIVDNLYYTKGVNEAIELPSKKKTITNLFDNETQNFLKKEKLSLKKEKDLVKIIEFYNSKN
jgi:hypothetical protein